MGHDENEQTLVKRRPTQDIVLPQRPVPIQAGFEVHQVATLSQAHFLGKASDLIKIRREVGDTPNTGLRKIVKFHVGAQSGFRTTQFSATVRTTDRVRK